MCSVTSYQSPIATSKAILTLHYFGKSVIEAQARTYHVQVDPKSRLTSNSKWSELPPFQRYESSSTDTFFSEASIAAAIRTVNAAFSSDPLIQWLRPNATPWAQPDKSVWEWQYRRIQSVMAHGRVLHSASVDEMALKFPRKQKESTESVETETTLAKEAQTSITSGVSGGEDSGAVVFLFPPKEQLSWSLSRLWLMWKLFWLDTLKPAYDTGCKELVSVIGRVHLSLLYTSVLISLSK